MRFGVWGLGFEVLGFGFLGFGDWKNGCGFWVKGVELRGGERERSWFQNYQRTSVGIRGLSFAVG